MRLGPFKFYKISVLCISSNESNITCTYNFANMFYRTGWFFWDLEAQDISGNSEYKNWVDLSLVGKIEESAMSNKGRWYLAPF